MRKLFLTILIVCMSVFCMSQEVVVTPSNTSGWTFGTSSPNTNTTASWYLGTYQGAPHLGLGAFWIYTGSNDGLAYARTENLKGVKIADIGKLRYRTYTALPLKNIAPQLNLRVDTNGDGRGDVWLTYEPGLQGVIPRNRWVEWNTLSGRWWCDKNGVNDLRTMDVWLRTFNLNSTIEYMQLQAGTWADPRSDWGWSWLGSDIVTTSVGLNPDVVYNFEPDSVLPNPQPKPIIPPSENPNKPVIVNPFVVVNPVVIHAPAYYIELGEKVGTKPIMDEPAKPTVEPSVPVDPYKTSNGIYVPLLFSGNTSLVKLLSQVEEIGNPDKQLTVGGAFKFGGVPFYIPQNRDNVWDAMSYKDDKEHKLVIKAGLEGAIEVHTIMNLSVWGKDKAGLFVEFRGSSGAFHRVELVANRDVRDWHKRDGDSILPPSHVVWSKPINNHKGHEPCEMRLDSQFFPLPAEFAKQELQSVTIVDRGGNKSQRVFVVGVTVKIQSK